MAWTTNGTISLNSGSPLVTGSGTIWASDGLTSPGDTLLVAGTLYEVMSIQTDTELTLASNYLGSTVANSGYAIIHTGLLPSALAANLAILQNQYLATIAQLYVWETATSGTTPLTNPSTGVTANVLPLQVFMNGAAQTSGATFTGPIVSNIAPGGVNFDAANDQTTLVAGAAISWSNFSGMIIVNQLDTGYITMYLCGSGAVGAIGSASAHVIGAFTFDSATSSYVFTNTDSVTHDYSFAAIRTRVYV